MAEQRTGTVFISYRRQDSAWPARQLYEALAARFGASNIFKDVDDIEPGEDFVDKITAAVAQCDVLLALIGPQWMTMTDAQGRRRLDDPEDFVRVEIGAALARGVRVIPILIDGAPMPAANELSPDLAPMVRRQAVAIDPVSFNTERLFGTLADLFESQRAARAEAAAAQAAADRVRAEEAQAEAARAETARAEAARAEAARAEEARAEAARAEEARAEAARAEAARAEDARAEQDRADAARAESSRAESARLEAAESSLSAAPTASGGDAAAPPADGAATTPGSARVTARRTPIGVLVAAGVAVALIATLLIWRPWQAAGGSASGAVPGTQPPTPSMSASATSSGRPSVSAGARPSGPDAVWAHRGGLEEHQFETEEAMEAAARAGFGIETDVRYTSDGVAVLIHDEAATKGLDCGGKDIQVSKTTWATLQKTCRSKPTATDPHSYEVPRFAATMESIAAASRTAWVYPEIKTDLNEAQTRKFLDVLIDAGLRNRVAVTSSSRERLALVRKLEPTLPTVLFVSRKRVDAAELAGDKLWGVAVEKGVATKAYVQQLQANGSKVVLWLLNDQQQFEWAEKLGADNVLTDLPDAYRTWSGAR